MAFLGAGSIITNGVYTTDSESLIKAPAALEALDGLVRGLEMAPLVSVVSDLAAAVLDIDSNMTSLVSAITGGGLDIPDAVQQKLNTIETNLNTLATNVNEISQKLVFINQGITDPEHISTFGEINGMVAVFTTNMAMLQNALQELDGTQFDLSGSSDDLSEVTTILQMTTTIDGLMESVNTLVLRITEIQLNMDTIKDLVVRQTLSSSVGLFLGRIDELLESLSYVTRFSDLHDRLKELLNNVADLSGVSIDDLSAYVDTSGFEFNLLKDVFDGVVCFGDDSMDNGGPSSFFYTSSAVNGVDDPSGYFPRESDGFYKGSFSNGSTWGTLLAESLETGSYSYGMVGSTISDGNAIAKRDLAHFGFLQSKDIANQLASFLPQDIVNPRKLYVVSAGRRDLIELLLTGAGLEQTQWATTVVDFLMSAAHDLVDAGAKVVLLATAIPMVGDLFKSNLVKPGDEQSLRDLQGDVSEQLSSRVNSYNSDHSDSLLVDWNVGSEWIDSLFADGVFVEGHNNLSQLYAEDRFDSSAFTYVNLTDEAVTSTVHLSVAKRAFNSLVQLRPYIKQLLV